MEADATLSGASGIVVDHTECFEDLGGTVIHLYGNGEVDLLTVLTEQISGGLIQFQHLRYMVKLGLRIFKGVIILVCHKIIS
jgi:hypothetical protein